MKFDSKNESSLVYITYCVWILWNSRHISMLCCWLCDFWILAIVVLNGDGKNINTITCVKLLTNMFVISFSNLKRSCDHIWEYPLITCNTISIANSNHVNQTWSESVLERRYNFYVYIKSKLCLPYFGYFSRPHVSKCVIMIATLIVIVPFWLGILLFFLWRESDTSSERWMLAN